MRGLAAVAWLAAYLASATALNADDDHRVPGNSPLFLCPGDRSMDTVKIDKVDLDPNPPKIGQKLVIKANGSVNEIIEKGAYVKVTVKYGLIRLVNIQQDLCDEIGNVELECPVEPGNMTISKSVELPKQIPPGKYFVQADVYNKDDKQMTCLNATVTFSLGGNSFFNNEL